MTQKSAVHTYMKLNVAAAKVGLWHIFNYLWEIHLATWDTY